MKQNADSAKMFIEAINQRRHTLYKTMKAIIERLEKGRMAGLRSRSLTRQEGDRLLRTQGMLYDISDKISDRQTYEDTFDIIRDDYSDRISRHTERADRVRARLDNLFSVAEKCWGDGKEMLLILTELTADPDSVDFISTYGCDAYFRHNKNLLFNERDLEIEKEIKELDI